MLPSRKLTPRSLNWKDPAYYSWENSCSFNWSLFNSYVKLQEGTLLIYHKHPSTWPNDKTLKKTIHSSFPGPLPEAAYESWGVLTGFIVRIQQIHRWSSSHLSSFLRIRDIQFPLQLPQSPIKRMKMNPSPNPP